MFALQLRMGFEMGFLGFGLGVKVEVGVHGLGLS